MNHKSYDSFINYNKIINKLNKIVSRSKKCIIKIMIHLK